MYTHMDAATIDICIHVHMCTQTVYYTCTHTCIIQTCTLMHIHLLLASEYHLPTLLESVLIAHTAQAQLVYTPVCLHLLLDPRSLLSYKQGHQFFIIGGSIPLLVLTETEEGILRPPGRRAEALA